MNDEQTKAQREFDAARSKMLTCPTVAQGAIRTETAYADAYQELVRVGLARQINTKYSFTELAHRR